MAGKINLKNISIVLNRPLYSENVGAAARAMRNMGLERLVAVNAKDFDRDKALKMATHGASSIVNNMRFSGDLIEALSSYHYIIGTTARLGGQRQVIQTPSKLAKSLVPLSLKNQIALLFGPEDRGLSNDDIRYCHILVNIPTAGFSSLNLAQAVMILCYELSIFEADEDKKFTPRLASRHELDGMYDQLKDILVRISYINPENPDYWLNKLRHFFSRIQLRAKEVSIIRGICRQIDWYGEKRYRDGLHNKR